MKSTIAINSKFRRVRPIAVKFSPDLETKKLEKLIDVVNNSMVHGVCIGNTTTRFNHTKLHGGYSGLHLYPIALDNIISVRQMTDLPIIACGGVSNARQAIRMIQEGASLVQLYTALVYKGIGVANQILKEMEEIMISEGFYSIEEMVGVNR